MTSATAPPQCARLQRHVTDQGFVMKEVAPDEWLLTAGDDRRDSLRACLEGRWLRMWAAMRARRKPPWRKLTMSCGLPFPWKIGVRNGGLELCADAPLDVQSPEQWVRWTLGAFPEALKRTAAKGRRQPPPDETAGEPDPEALESVEATLVAGGWRFSRRSDGEFDIILQGGGESRHARMTLLDGDGVRLRTPFMAVGCLTDTARDAIACLLLTANQRLRLARAALWNDALGERLGAEIALPGSPPGCGGLDAAIGALTCWQALLGRELSALRQPALAARYLEMRGWSRPAAGKEVRNRERQSVADCQ